MIFSQCGVCVCVCVCVRPSVHPSIVFLENAGSSERQTWTCYEVGNIDLKIRLWSGGPREVGETGGCRGECAFN